MQELATKKRDAITRLEAAAKQRNAEVKAIEAKISTEERKGGMKTTYSGGVRVTDMSKVKNLQKLQARLDLLEKKLLTPTLLLA
jgi:hypothetical protein